MTERMRTTLNQMAPGQSGCILALRGGRCFQQRITSLGLSVGCDIEVLQKAGAENEDGPVVVRCGDTRLMVGHGMADKVVVRVT